MANTTVLNTSEVAVTAGLILAAVVEAAALLGNGALLVVGAAHPRLRDTLYLVHLCVVDLLAAASIMPLACWPQPPPGLGRVRLGPAPCRAARFLSAALLPACTLGVAALGLARYRLIVHPLRPGARPPPGLVLTAVWAAAGLLGALSLPRPPPAPPRLQRAAPSWPVGLGPFRPLWALLAFALPALLLLGAYGGIFLVARRAALRPLRPPRPARGRLSILPPLRPRLPGGKAALAPALAVGQFAACWLPYGCACWRPLSKPQCAEAPRHLGGLLGLRGFTPFLYGLLQRPVRRALGRLARRALPQPPADLYSRAWHLPTFLQHLQGPSLRPALGPSWGTRTSPRFARRGEPDFLVSENIYSKTGIEKTVQSVCC
uniref:G protein-coupled receptor 62 n=1 Tax=Lynx canadensis TaxID=61383 RepID=A0A667GWN9_LYNCA